MLKSITEIKEGISGEITLLAKSVSSAIDKNGGKYQKIKVKDINGNESVFVLFNDSLSEKVPAVMTFKIKSKGGGIMISSYKENKDIDPSMFLAKPNLPIKACIKRYESIVSNLRTPLKEIAIGVIEAQKEKWSSRPMDESGAYCRFGGIMEASIKLANMAENAANTYGLDKDLINAGALLYYIGNVNLLNDTFIRTLKSVLTDTSAVAYSMIESAVNDMEQSGKIDVCDEISMQDVSMLENIILSANDNKEPMTTEAVCLKKLSEMNIELDVIATATKGVRKGSVIDTDKTENKKVYIPKEEEKFSPVNATAV